MNRSFLYGDGFFETIYTESGKFPLIHYHVKRAKETAQFFEMDWPKEWTEEYWLNQLRLRTTDIPGPAAIRITFFRSGEGTYVPTSDQMDYHVLVRTVKKPFSLPTQQTFKTFRDPKQVIIYPDMLKPINPLSAFKSTSSAFYVKAGLYQKKHGSEGLILLNEYGRVCEELKSTIWIESDGRIITPPLSEGPLNGTLRRYMLENLEVHEEEISPSRLRNARKIWAGNSIRGLVPLTLT
jgi:branched-chain amino acid aminotransferase